MDHLVETRPVNQLIGSFSEGLVNYREQNWSRALQIFQRSATIEGGDRVSRLYWNRCKYFMERPPPPDWDGVWTMQTK